MQHFLHSLADFFAPRPVQSHIERLSKYMVIEALNDCGEKRYIEMHKPTSVERRENLEVLLTKCKRLLSFVTKKKYDEDISYKVINLSDRVRQAMYMNDDIAPLFDDFEIFENLVKRNSKSSMNLSSVESL
jgi:hypothetical protein